MMNKDLISSNINEIDSKKDEIIQNNLGKITISNSIKKSSIENEKKHKKKILDEETSAKKAKKTSRCSKNTG